MSIPVQDVKQRVIAEFGYREQDAERVANSLQTCAPVIQKAFEQWWRNGSIDAGLEIHGYTLKRLMDDYDFNPVNALLTLDWLLREPEMALAALSEGYDDIE